MIFSAFSAFLASISTSSRVRRVLFIIAFASAAWSRANAAPLAVRPQIFAMVTSGVHARSMAVSTAA